MQREQGKKFLDLKLKFGQDQGGMNLGNAKLDCYFKPEQIGDLCSKANIRTDNIGEDLILKFDFVTHQGRQKDALEYFQIGFDESSKHEYNTDLSPLQNIFNRSTGMGKTELFESKRQDGKSCVTILYQFYKENVKEDWDEEFIQFLDGLQKAEFNPDLHLDLLLMGRVLSNKPNRITLKVDYADLHLTSDQFRFKDFLRLLDVMKAFGEYEEEAAQTKNNPIFKLFEQAEQLQAEISEASFSKLLELYEAGYTKNGKDQDRWENFHQKEAPERTKGVFKDAVDITFVYGDKLGFRAECTYDSEPVLVRLLTGAKKYIDIYDSG